MHKKLIMFAFLAISIGLSFQAEAKPTIPTPQQITGTWKVTTTGEDSNSKTARKWGVIRKWIISEVNGELQVETYNIFKSGEVSKDDRTVTFVTYRDGELSIATRPGMLLSNMIINTYYEISFLSGMSATGQYVEINGTSFGAQLDPLSPDKTSVKHFGTIKMSKSSGSTEPPKSTFREISWKADPMGQKVHVGKILVFVDEKRDIVFRSSEATVRFIELAMEGGMYAQTEQGAMLLNGSIIPIGGPAQGKVMKVEKRNIGGKPIILIQLQVISAKDMERVPADKIVWIGLKG